MNLHHELIILRVRVAITLVRLLHLLLSLRKILRLAFNLIVFISGNILLR